MEALKPGDPGVVGRYRLTARLGQGAIGTVFLGRDGARRAAVKVIRPDLAHDDRFATRLKREVESARKVKGIGIAAVIAVGLDASPPWVATEYVEGVALDAVVASCGPLPEHTARALAGDLADALAAVHSAGVVHGSLRAASVLVAEDGPYLTDFAFPAAPGSAQPKGLLPAPEQVTGGTVGPAADVFALGGVVCAAVGVDPFGRGTAAEIAQRVLRDEPDIELLPESLRPFVTACLRRKPSARPGAAELADLLVDDADDDESEDVAGLPTAILAFITKRTDEAATAAKSAAAVAKAAASPAGAMRPRSATAAKSAEPKAASKPAPKPEPKSEPKAQPGPKPEAKPDAEAAPPKAEKAESAKPKTEKPKAPEPRTTELKATESKATESRTTEPKAAEPKTPGPRPAAPKTADPETAQLKAVAPRPSEKTGKPKSPAKAAPTSGRPVKDDKADAAAKAPTVPLTKRPAPDEVQYISRDALRKNAEKAAAAATAVSKAPAAPAADPTEVVRKPDLPQQPEPQKPAVAPYPRAAAHDARTATAPRPAVADTAATVTAAAPEVEAAPEPRRSDTVWFAIIALLGVTAAGLGVYRLVDSDWRGTQNTVTGLVLPGLALLCGVLGLAVLALGALRSRKQDSTPDTSTP